MNCRRHYRPIGDNLRQFDMGRKHIGRQGGELPGDSVKPVKRFNASTSPVIHPGSHPGCGASNEGAWHPQCVTQPMQFADCMTVTGGTYDPFV